RTGHLVDQMQADVELSLTVRKRPAGVEVPDLLEERAGHTVHQSYQDPCPSATPGRIRRDAPGEPRPPAGGRLHGQDALKRPAAIRSGPAAGATRSLTAMPALIAQCTEEVSRRQAACSSRSSRSGS